MLHRGNELTFAPTFARLLAVAVKIPLLVSPPTSPLSRQKPHCNRGSFLRESPPGPAPALCAPTEDDTAMAGKGLPLGGCKALAWQGLPQMQPFLPRTESEHMFRPSPPSLEEDLPNVRGSRFPSGASFLKGWQPKCSLIVLPKTAHSRTTEKVGKWAWGLDGMVRETDADTLSST